MAFPILIAATNLWVQTVCAKNTRCFPEAREDAVLGALEPLHPLVAIPFSRQ